MNYPLKYPKIQDLAQLQYQLVDYAKLKFECGSDAGQIEQAMETVHAALNTAMKQLLALPEDAALAAREPNALEDIKKLRPQADRRLWHKFNQKTYADRVAGAFIGRMAGCTLGAPVECWSIKAMEDWAAYTGDAFPPVDYWSAMKNPCDTRYEVSTYYDYTRPGINGVPVDDDVTYTLLGLLIAENYSLDFTIEQNGEGWLKYLPDACTAEAVALNNLKAGMSARLVGENGNPYMQWIGADIRSDPWGYLAPGQPERAADMAYRDAWLSHRRNGIYGEMYFSAVIAAAFAVNDPVEALRLGLNEIPADCLLAGDIRWALELGGTLSGYADANRAVKERFGDMSPIHTNDNACLTVFGLMIGGDDFSRCIGETVAMSYDNDCTTATVGSIFGAAKGIGSIPEHWYKGFHNKVLTYLNGHPSFAIDDVLERFAALAAKGF
jgi:ADP-ribosylglycohydrolase